MSRSSSYNRDISRRKALRKRRLAKEIYYDEVNYPFYDNLHQYSKNKIHCSCPMCSAKTRNKGRRNRKNYARSLNYKCADLRKLMAMDNSLEEYTGIKIHRPYKNW